MAKRVCPSGDEITAFVLGKLSEPNLTEIASHLDECTTCEAAADRLDQLSDDVIVGLRRPVPVGSARPGTINEQPPPTLLGDYRIIRELGRGGMGIVYEAEQVSLGRRVALKVLPQQLLRGEHAVERFRREARAAARLHHTNIVQVYGTGEHDGIHYFVMQLIPGAGLDRVVRGLRRSHHSELGAPPSGVPVDQTAEESSLSAIIARLVGWPEKGNPQARFQNGAGNALAPLGDRDYWERVARIGLQVAEALTFAHAHGVLHRDVKPSNLLLDLEGQAWLADFGLAKETADVDDFTASGFLIGTIRYAPPERLEGQSDARGDVYGVGISLYELLTLTSAYSESDRSKLLRQIVHEDPQPPRKLNPAVPRDLETIVQKAIARDPSHRYQTVNALAEDLRLFLDDKPIRARRVNEVEKAWRWCRRNPIPASLASCFVLALLLGSAGIAWKWREAEHERNKAEIEKGRVILAEGQTARERDLARQARDDSRRVLAGVMLDQGTALADQGYVGEGLFWMLDALRVTPAEDVELARVIRTNFAGWLDQSHGLRAMSDQPEIFRATAFSADSRRFLTVSRAGTTIWSSDTGQPEGIPLEGSGPAAFSPDGKSVLTTNGKSWRIARWDLATRQPIGAPLPQPGAVTAAAYSPDGAQIVTGGTDGRVRLWDAKTGLLQLEADALEGEKVAVSSVDWSPDGRILAVATTAPGGQRASHVHLWDIATGKPVGAPLRHNKNFTRVFFSPDGTRLLSARDDGIAQLWDVSTREPAGPAMRHPSGTIVARFTPDGRTLVTGSDDGIIRWWDTSSGDALVGSLPRHRGSLYDLAVSPDGRTLVAVGGEEANGTMCLWQLATGLSRPVRKERGTFAKASWALNETLPWFGRQSVAYSPDATAVLTGGQHASAHLFGVATQMPLVVPPRTYFDGAYFNAFSPDGRLAATSSQDVTPNGDVLLWNTATGKAIGRPLAHLNWVAALAFSPDGQFLVTGGYDKAIHIWDPRTARRVGAAIPQGAVVHRLVFSPDGKTLAIGLAGDSPAANSLVLWDFATRQPIRAPIEGNGIAFQFSNDGTTLATARGASLRVFQTVDWRAPGAPILEASDIQALAFSPDGRHILTGTTEGTARCWDAHSGLPEGAPMLHPDRVNVVAFSPDGDGRTILTACADGSAQLWDRLSSKRLGPPVLQAHALWAARFTPDGQRFLTTTDDGDSRIWPRPAPATDDLERLSLRLQVRTGREMAPGHTVLQLTHREWELRRERLAELERSVETAYGSSVRDWAYHDARAKDAESDNAQFAVRWHLNRMIAIEAHTSESDSKPTTWSTHARRARSFAADGKLVPAAADYDRAVKRATPADMRAWYSLVISQCQARNESALARWYLDRALAAAPGDGTLHADRASLELEAGDLKASEADLAQALEHGADPALLFRLADDYALEDRWRSAALALAKGVEKGGPGLHFGWKNQALMLLKGGDEEGYRKLCARILEIARELPHPMVLNAALWVCALGPDAVEDFSPLVAALEPVSSTASGSQQPELLNTLGALLYRAGRCREAIARLEQSTKATGGHGRFEDWIFLAMAHARLGEKREANLYFEKTRQPGIDSAERWQKVEREYLSEHMRKQLEAQKK
jgi:WD40 repeat protein/serine/threonine protein kinase/tetratricopeptide (TPR) repeat protein